MGTRCLLGRQIMQPSMRVMHMERAQDTAVSQWAGLFRRDCNPSRTALGEGQIGYVKCVMISRANRIIFRACFLGAAHVSHLKSAALARGGLRITVAHLVCYDC